LAITAANLQIQRYQFQYQTAIGIWKWSSVVDMSGISPVYRVEDIVTPYGLLRDTIPIPGEIIEAMNDSISQLQTQFQPTILIGPPSSVTFDLNEGEGFGEAQEVFLTNTGTYGSLLGVSFTSSASYLTVTPATLGNLASNEAGAFEVAADSTNLLAVNSPYSETIIVTDVAASNSPQTLTVTINVLPKATITTSSILLTFNVVKPLSGDFPAIPSQAFNVENTGPALSELVYQIQKLGTVNWLTGFDPVSGSLDSGEIDPITVTVGPPQSTGVGTYEETLRVSGYSTNQFVDVTIRLVVT